MIGHVSEVERRFNIEKASNGIEIPSAKDNKFEIKEAIISTFYKKWHEQNAASVKLMRPRNTH